MKMKTRGALLALAFAAVTSFSRAEMIPKGWVKAGSVPQMYDVTLLRNADGRSKVTLSSTAGKSVVLPQPLPRDVFGTLMQTIEPSAYAGKRLRLTATVSADNVLGWAGLWMRVDGAQGKVLAFDNMETHPIKGSTDPRKYRVVLDIPESAQSLSYGILLDGAGAVTLSGFRVETVGKDVPVTSGPIAEPLPAKPVNLDFSE